MKKSLLIITLVLLTLNVFSQAPHWAWAKSSGGVNDDNAYSCSTDASGNIIVTGFFRGLSISFGTTTLTNVNAGTWDMFIVKYDSNGNVIWAKRAGGTNDDRVNSCSTDAGGNIIVTGFFVSPSIIFGTDTLVNAGNGNNDIFIVKYDSNGNVLWAKRAGGTNYDNGNSCGTDANSNIFVVGDFSSSSINFGADTLVNAGSSDIFVVKYDSNGNVVWAKSEGSNGGDGAYGCSTEVTGNIIVTGNFNSSNISFGTITLPNNGGNDIYVVKYDSNGNAVWAKSAGGTSNDNGSRCSIDVNGNITVVGDFQSSTIIFGTDTLVNMGNSDIYVVKYDSTGNIIWAKSAGGTGYYGAFGCSTDANGNIIVIGNFNTSSISFGTTTLANAGFNNDMFIVKYDSNGNVLWAKRAGGTSDDHAFGCSTDASGNIIVSGYFSSSSLIFGNTTLANAGGYYNMFVSKININCFAYYTTTYDSISNNFTLTVDTAAAAFAVSYHWDFGDGTTSTLAYPSHTYAVDSLYNVCMKVYTATGDSCEYCHIIGIDTSGNVQRTAGFTLNVFNPTTVSVNDISKEKTVSIFPNPFTSATTITFTEPQKNTTIKIMDVTGREIKTINFTGKQCVIEKGEMKAGVYFVEVRQDPSISLPEGERKPVYKKLVVQ